MDSIHTAVKRMYEAFPYPHYALWLPIRWQEGYMGLSAVSKRLNNKTIPLLTKRPRQILIAGSGDMQPYVLRHLEPWFHRIHSVDLSQRSLSRARLRLGWRRHHTSFVASDIDVFLRRTPLQFDHIDSYGVLHHLSSPATTLRLMRQRLQADGTLRIMVYNERSRRWIHHLQRAFALLKIDPYRAEDRQQARQLLELLAKESPAYRERLTSMGVTSLRHNSRFVDTFLHRREARIPLQRWFALFAEVGLEPYALFDRYGELDDLKCPLTHMPTAQELERRAADGRFENNLEIFLRVKNPYHDAPTSPRAPSSSQSTPWSLFGRRYPLLWFDFPETHDTPILTRWKLWFAYLRHLRNATTGHLSPKWLTRQPLARLQRLARVGAIFRTQLPDKTWQDRVASPITSDMERPQLPPPTSIENDEIKQWIQSRSLRIAQDSPAFCKAVMNRLRAGEIY